MAEYSPFGPESTDDDDELESSSASNKKKRAAGGLGASLLGREVTKSDTTEKPVPRSFGEALDALLGNKKAEKEEVAEKARTIPWDREEGVAEPVEAISVGEEAPEAKSDTIELRPDGSDNSEGILDIDSSIEPEGPRMSEAVRTESEEIAENDNEATEEELHDPAEVESNDNETENHGASEEATEEIEDDSTAPKGNSSSSSAGGSSAGSPSGTSGSSGSSSSSPIPTPVPVPAPVGPTPPTPPIPPVPGGPIPPGGSFNAMPTPIATPEEVDEAYLHGRRRGFQRGFLGGLIVGGGIEHIRHKRREKRMEKSHEAEFNKQERKLEDVESGHKIAEEKRQSQEYWDEKKKSEEQRRKEAEHKNELAKKEVARNSQTPQDKHIIAPIFSKGYEHLKPPSETDSDEPEVALEELKLERSAWHNIEVDRQGKAIENTKLEYGHEYFKEKQKERGPKEDVHGAAGEVALVASAFQDSSHERHLGRIKSTVGLSSKDSTKLLKEANANGLSKSLKKALSPPTTAFATVVWAAALLTLTTIFIIFVF